MKDLKCNEACLWMPACMWVVTATMLGQWSPIHGYSQPAACTGNVCAARKATDGNTWLQQQTILKNLKDTEEDSQDVSELHNAEMEDAKTSVVAAGISQTTDTCDVYVLRAEIVSSVANSHTSDTITATWYGADENSIPYVIGSVSRSGISAVVGWDGTWLLENPAHHRWTRVHLEVEGTDAALLDNLRMDCGIPRGPGYDMTTQRRWGSRNNIGWCLSADECDGFNYKHQTLKGQRDGCDRCGTTLQFGRHGVSCEIGIYLIHDC